MKYKVTGTMRWTVEMTVDANSKAEAEQAAMDRMSDGATDGFRLVETQDDNEIDRIEKVK